MKMEELYVSIAAIGRRFGAQRVVLFGSRARGDHRERSDIDLAVYGVPRRFRSDFEDAIDELPMLLPFDLVFIGADNDRISDELIANIERDGIDIMTKFNEKYARFCLAVDRLEEAIELYRQQVDETLRETLRDSVIQRFEFSVELAWKTLREYVLEQGAAEGNIMLNSPKRVVREAYVMRVIDNETAWSNMLKDRNMTSHVYNEEDAVAVFARICMDYLDILKQLRERLRSSEAAL